MTKITTESLHRSQDFFSRYIRPGDTIYSILLHTSKSGMMRTFKFLMIVNNEIYDISVHITNVLANTRYDKKRYGVSISGTGMDMSLAVIYDLSSALFGSETQLKQREF